MNLLWPGMLVLLAGLPILVAVYAWSLRRRRRFVVRYSSLSLVRDAIPARSSLRRHIPFALFLAALASLVVAFSRPVNTILVPNGQATVVLTMDVSRSMIQRDIYPSRLEAAKDAALDFVLRQQANNQIAVVAFAGYSQLVQPPTSEIDDLRTAIRGLTTGRGTAIGHGIIEALETIGEVNANVADMLNQAGPNGVPATGSGAGSGAGSFVPDIIVVLTDGVNTTGPEPLDAAQIAAASGVRVYTIGYGSDLGGSQGQSADQWGWGGFRHGIDEATLREIAAMTGGEYYAAESASELQKVFESLPLNLNTREETTEISFLFAAAGALLAAAAVLLSQLWHPLP